MKGAHQLVVIADYVNILGKIIKTIKKNTEAISDISKEFHVEVNT